MNGYNSRYIRYQKKKKADVFICTENDTVRKPHAIILHDPFVFNPPSSHLSLYFLTLTQFDPTWSDNVHLMDSVIVDLHSK